MFHHLRYLDRFNNDRISLRLDGLSRVRYRAQALAALDFALSSPATGSSALPRVAMRTSYDRRGGVTM
ncbi:hypothetical protein CH263_22920 [Rhodococcus sp. 06-1059B-a]|nr:hypothetical protein CH263_22920 [Rhodococcus sp. 06-1059B-a]